MAARAQAVTVDEGSDQILDAALATVLDFGIRRATVSEVARRAELSRMTVYRRYPDGAQLIRALMTREFGRLLAGARDEVASAATGRDRVVRAGVRTIEGMMTHQLMLRLLELEPETTIPYLTQRVGRFQQMAREAIASLIADGQRDGSIRAGDPDALAAACETASRGLVMAARALSTKGRATALAEFELMIDAYLRP
jgi:AcrR family transcriptional regulator